MKDKYVISIRKYVKSVDCISDKCHFHCFYLYVKEFAEKRVFSGIKIYRKPIFQTAKSLKPCMRNIIIFL